MDSKQRTLSNTKSGEKPGPSDDYRPDYGSVEEAAREQEGLLIEGKPRERNLYLDVLEKTKHDVAEVFGPSGSGKTTFALEVAKDALKLGKTVEYVDTERNLVEAVKGMEYVYLPSFEEAFNHVRNLNKKYDVVILDSLGLPALGGFAIASMKERGEMLLRAQAMAYKLKTYSKQHGALIVVTNQPVSNFGKVDAGPEELYPFGEKSIFFFKEVWRTVKRSSDEQLTVCDVTAFRSRFAGFGKRFYSLRISDRGVQVEYVS